MQRNMRLHQIVLNSLVLGAWLAIDLLFRKRPSQIQIQDLGEARLWPLAFASQSLNETPALYISNSMLLHHRSGISKPIDYLR